MEKSVIVRNLISLYPITKFTFPPVSFVLLFTISSSLVVVEHHQVWKVGCAWITLIPHPSNFHLVGCIGMKIKLSDTEKCLKLFYKCDLLGMIIWSEIEALNSWISNLKYDLSQNVQFLRTFGARVRRSSGSAPGGCFWWAWRCNQTGNDLISTSHLWCYS